MLVWVNNSAQSHSVVRFHAEVSQSESRILYGTKSYRWVKLPIIWVLIIFLHLRWGSPASSRSYWSISWIRRRSTWEASPPGTRRWTHGRICPESSARPDAAAGGRPQTSVNKHANQMSAETASVHRITTHCDLWPVCIISWSSSRTWRIGGYESGQMSSAAVIYSI